MDDSFQLDDTIAALASAPGPAERGIVRASGVGVRDVLSQVFEPDDPARWTAARRPLRHSGAMSLEDLHFPLKVDVLLWPTSRSYTGEPIAEIHTVGSPPLLEAILSSLFEAGARPARRGEFTLRAFLAGRIDLLQAEAVLGVIDAGDQQQLQVALGQLGGGLSTRIAHLHEQLLLHLADLEAGLDFVEEDIEFISRDELQRRLREGIEFLQGLIRQSMQRMQSTGRRRVALAGLPNAGKSTLFNALLEDERAIVSEVAGTTRDYLSALLDCEGVPVELIDTAGWDQRSTGIGRSADELRQDQWDRADLVVWCTAADLSVMDRAVDESLRQDADAAARPLLEIVTKGDCRPAPADALVVSATTGAGLDQLRQAIGQQLQSATDTGDILGSTSARCRESLVSAESALRRAGDAAAAGAGDELIAVELRDAIDHLGKIAGKIYTDDVLDRIFSRFCIGK